MEILEHVDEVVCRRQDVRGVGARGIVLIEAQHLCLQKKGGRAGIALHVKYVKMKRVSNL